MPWIAAFVALTQLLAATLVAPPLGAQRRDSLAVAVGARVRVILNERPTVRIIGAYVGADSTGVMVHDDRAEKLVATDWKDVESIEVFRRRLTNHEAFSRGARAGAIVFGTIAVAGLVTAIVWDARGGCENVDYCVPATLVILPVGYLFTIGGTVLGGTLGLLFQDNWRTVWRPR
jgi:hypothetical protein